MKVKDFFVNYEEILQRISSHKIILSILFLSLIVFSPVFTGSEFLTYDDNWYIYENENVINLSWKSIVNIFTTLQGGQYSPLGEVYHSFLYYLFGENATAFKICAVLIHLLNVFLLFKIFINIFQNKLFVTTVVLFFAIHPIQVEVIGWISVIFRNAVTFMFLGYLFYIKYLEHNFEKYRLIPVLLCFVLAFLTKEQAILFPVGLFLIHIMKVDSIWNRRLMLEMIFWSALVLIFSLITVEITKTGGPSIVNRSVSFYDKLALLAKTVLAYPSNFLFPFKLSFSYPYPIEKSNISFLTILIATVVLLFGCFISFKNKIIRFGFLWALGFLSLGLAFAFFHLRDTFMADRYAYVALIGFSVLLYKVLTYFKNLLSSNVLFLVLISYFIFSNAVLSFNRLYVFKNSKNLWTQAVKVNSKNQYAYNSLGFYYRSENKPDTAFTLYKKALNIDSNYYLAHSNIGKVYFNKKQYDSALFHVSKAIAINPLYTRAYKNRAAIYSKTNQKELLLADLNKILDFEPNNTKYQIERAKIYFKQKKYEDVITESSRIIELDDDNANAYYLIGHSSLMRKDYEKANLFMNKAIERDGSNGMYYFVRSLCQYRVGNMNGALQDAAKAQKIGYKVNGAYLKGLIQEIQKQRK